MILLQTKGVPVNIAHSLVATLSAQLSHKGFIAQATPENTTLHLSTASNPMKLRSDQGVFKIPSLSHLSVGDIVLIEPTGYIRTLYRINSDHNSLFITDRCNSNCLMCSQPPRNVNDLDYFFQLNSSLIPLLPKNTKELGITGGEPTLLGQRFITLLQLITQELPTTEIHILTNGRSFAWKHISQSLAAINNPRIVYGIPLYSDYYQQHDFIVQAKDAFHQTVLGLHQLAIYDIRVEIRIVLHKQTYKRLPKLAKYIYQNFPFVEHVAFMGLEFTGLTIKNSHLLWMEPTEYETQLEEAVLFLHSMGIRVSIYNLQHCLVRKSLWPFMTQSISDWKQEYLHECNDCKMLEACGGVFATSRKLSSRIMAVK